jgi:hypothetical protein
MRAMELVLLQDVVASYGSLWIRVANTQGHEGIQMHDRFREKGFGEGAEELEIEGVDISPVSGASRIFFRRAANNTRAEVHRLGAVMQLVGSPTSIAYGPSIDIRDNVLLTDIAQVVVKQLPEIPEGLVTPPIKRGRGRPPGSKNKPKAPLQSRPQVPAWPGV